MAGISAEIRTAATRDGLQTAISREVTNGGVMNPGAGETWIQIHFNFKRNFPSIERHPDRCLAQFERRFPQILENDY